MARNAHRADHRAQIRADLAVLLHLPRGLADRLDDQRDRALGAVEIGDGERNALAVLVRHDDDELSGLRRFRHQRMAEFQQIGDVGKVLTRDDFKALFGNSRTWAGSCPGPSPRQSFPLRVLLVLSPLGDLDQDQLKCTQVLAPTNICRKLAIPAALFGSTGEVRKLRAINGAIFDLNHSAGIAPGRFLPGSGFGARVSWTMTTTFARRP